MAIIRSFRDLRAYQQARIEGSRVFEMTKTFPKEEKFSLTDQIRRSSRAVKSMLAEAWGHRRYPAAFISKLTDAIGEANETQSWLDDALDCGYLKLAQHQELDAAWQAIGGMIHNMILRADDFCGTKKD
jgi:four helix bundle protein